MHFLTLKSGIISLNSLKYIAINFDINFVFILRSWTIRLFGQENIYIHNYVCMHTISIE